MPPEPPRLSLSLAFESFEARKESRKTLLGFSLIYLTGYFTDPPATFHPQLVHALEDERERRVLILGFRGSGIRCASTPSSPCSGGRDCASGMSSA
jgi:hypothetical protein